MLEILLFAALGIVVGIAVGLVPGIHPNMIVLLVPLLISLDIEPVNLIALITALGVTNSIVDFIPSILLGAPEAGNELSVLPGHKLLIRGFGYEAIKLTVVGCVGSVIIVMALLPAMVLAVPALFSVVRPFIYLLLLFIVLLMVLTEGGIRRVYAALFFLASGAIGLSMDKLPIDSTLLLFPVFSGFFGLSTLMLQLRTKTKIRPQHFDKIILPARLRNRSILFGSIGGIFAGFLPGVGSSEIATMSTVDKNDRSFLVTLGALTTANIIFSVLALWLIERTRSGVAVAISQVAEIGVAEMLVIISVSVLSVGVAAIATLKLAKLFVRRLERVNYSFVSKAIILFIILVTFVFAGFVGLLLLTATASLGLLANLLSVKRGNLMGVLILPTMLFYAGF